jgi:hypothetical protein
MMTCREFIDAYCAGGFTFADVRGEVRELAEEVRRGSWAGMSEEFWDVAHVLQLWAYTRTGLDLPLVMPPSHYMKYIVRDETWRRIFSANGLVFSPRFLRAGSNHRKPHKVAAALAAAREVA